MFYRILCLIIIVAVLSICPVNKSLGDNRHIDFIQQELDRIEQSKQYNIVKDIGENVSDKKVRKPAEFRENTIDVLNFKNKDINEILDIIAQKTGLNIIANRYFNKQITIYLRNIDVFDALRIILDSNDLAYAVKDGNIYVMGADVFYKKFGYKFGQKIHTKIIELKNASSKRILTILKGMKSDKGNILFNDVTNSIILIDKKTNLEKMASLIAQMDVPVKSKTFIFENVDPASVIKKVQGLLTKNIGQVELDDDTKSITVTDLPEKIDSIKSAIELLDSKDMNFIIKAKVIQVTLNDENINGIGWKDIVSEYKQLKIKGFHNKEWKSDIDYMSIGTISKEDYYVLLDALETVGLINNISDEKIKIKTQDAIRVIVNSNTLKLYDNTLTKMKSPQINEDAIFFIKPKFAEKDILDIDIKATVVNSDEKIKVKFDNLIPVNFKLKINDTIVIGGLYKEEPFWGIQKIPFIGKIPFLGSAFKIHKHNLKKTEIVVLLTLKQNNVEEEANKSE